ncbi:MAG: class I SAM-dependent methyltransferase [bacterium]|nr:class I SAM-dependent methyltransferase [bacterium]
MSSTSRLEPTWWDHQRYPLLRLRRRIERELALALEPKPGETIVDLGCGDMPYRPLFENLGCSYVGCDLEDSAQVGIEPGVPVPLPDAAAHGVVSFQVLEHVWDLDWYLGECRRLLRADGWLLLSTHGAWLYHPHPTDFRRWTQDGLTAELVGHGFRVESVTGVMGPLAWTTQFRLLGFRQVLRRIPLLGRFLLPLLSVVMNVRMELEDAVTPAQVRQDNACIYVVVARPSV